MIDASAALDLVNGAEELLARVGADPHVDAFRAASGSLR